jgi:hypothetical protein
MLLPYRLDIHRKPELTSYGPARQHPNPGNSWQIGRIPFAV